MVLEPRDGRRDTGLLKSDGPEQGQAIREKLHIGILTNRATKDLLWLLQADNLDDATRLNLCSTTANCRLSRSKLTQ